MSLLHPQVPHRVPPLLRLLAQVDEQLVHLHHRQLLLGLQLAQILRAADRRGETQSDFRGGMVGKRVWRGRLRVHLQNRSHRNED